MNPQELGLVKCDGCGSFVDPKTCGCGYPINHPYMDGHSGIPQGCSCRRDRQIKWKPDDPVLAPGDPEPRPAVVLEVLPNDWIKVRYPVDVDHRSDELKWKRWELKPRLRCPFCGGNAASVVPDWPIDSDARGNDIRSVQCSDCSAEGPYATGRDLMVWGFWNLRNADPAALSDKKRISFPSPPDEVERTGRKADVVEKLEPNLKPCPFCSSKNVLLIDVSDEPSQFFSFTFDEPEPPRPQEMWFVQCQNCHSGGPCQAVGEMEIIPEQAAEAWNKRA